MAWTPALRADDVDAARQLFADGVKLFQRGDYEGARLLFRRADAAHHAPPIVYNIGLAEERAGHPQAAVDAYEAYVAETGDAAELTSAAVVAIAQIKAHSTRLRIQTRPPGARIFVDAATLVDASPTTFLVRAGHHVVVAQGDGWRAEQELEAKGEADTLTVLLHPEATAVPTVVPAVPAVVPAVVAAPSAIERSDHAEGAAHGEGKAAVPEAAGPSGFVWGVAFAVAPYHLQGTGVPGAQNAVGATQVMAGAILEAGHAITDRFELVGRGLLALGPDGRPTYAWMGGPGISFRLGAPLWVGATFIGGQLEARAHGNRYGTDLVFGTMLEAALVVIATPSGQWTVGTQPGLLLTAEPTQNTAFFAPVTFGYRGY